MRDEALTIRREIGLRRGKDRRQQAANSFAHAFTSNITCRAVAGAKAETSSIDHPARFHFFSCRVCGVPPFYF
jgi:hypothetical protein